jgi:hypothetical protein
MRITIAPQSFDTQYGVVLICETDATIRGYRLTCNGDAQALKTRLGDAHIKNANFEPDDIARPFFEAIR